MGERLTKRDIEKIEEEIEHRKLVIRKEAIEAVKEARAQGDLSENFEYYAAKKEKNKNESRIRFLERMIKTAQIVEDAFVARAGERSVRVRIDVLHVEEEHIGNRQRLFKRRPRHVSAGVDGGVNALIFQTLEQRPHEIGLKQWLAARYGHASA